MIDIFKVEDHKLVLNHEYLRGIPGFKVIIERDKSSDKKIAYAELLYIYYWTAYSSPFSKLSVEDRHKKCVSYSELPVSWRRDKLVEGGIRDYDTIQKAENPSEILAQCLKESLHMTAYVIKELTARMQEKLQIVESAKTDVEVTVTKELLWQDMNTLFKLSDSLPEAFKNLEKLEKIVAFDQGQVKKISGGHEKGMYEDPSQEDREA
jgi:uncharacterized protein YjgD (DUF1641 family)